MTPHQPPRQAAAIESYLRRIPYAQFLGFTLIADGSDVIGRMAYADHLIGNPLANALHGGTLAALLEFTATCRLMMLTAEPRLPKIINISVDYLRSGRPRDTYARATVTRQGRLLANVRVAAYQEEIARPIATANAHFLLAGR